MAKEYSNKNLQKTSFKNEDLSNASFADSDLRGADFSGANLTGANFTHVKTGIPTLITALLFLAAIIASLLAGYIAMLTGRTVQEMLASTDQDVKYAAYLSIALDLFFIIYAWWKGVNSAIKNLVLPVVTYALLLATVFNLSGLGTGKGMLYMILNIVLMVVMFIVGAMARSAAGSLSGIFFIIVALSGGMFGKSLGGGIGTVIMAVACAVISKKALSGAQGFDFLQKIALSITKKFGTSFRNTKLANADFSRSKIQNADFANADIAAVNWGDSKKMNYISSENKFTSK
jgi:uncharacterized protein YjbI with pentapeptide repeats